MGESVDGDSPELPFVVSLRSPTQGVQRVPFVLIAGNPAVLRAQFGAMFWPADRRQLVEALKPALAEARTLQ